MQCRPSICIWGYSWRRDVCLFELLLFHLLIKNIFRGTKSKTKICRTKTFATLEFQRKRKILRKKTLMCYLVLRRIYSTTMFVLINIIKETCNHNHILEYSYIQYRFYLHNSTCYKWDMCEKTRLFPGPHSDAVIFTKALARKMYLPV